MMKCLVIIVTLLLLVLTGCNNENENKKRDYNDVEENNGLKESPFGDTLQLSDLKNTNFITLLDEPLQGDSNVIYAPTVIYAWRNIEQNLGKVFVPDTSVDLLKLHQDKYANDALDSGDYSVSFTREDDLIRSNAMFSFNLPFKEPFDIDPYALHFNKTSKVESFSFDGSGDEQATIVYYNSDDDCAIKLHPEDQNHEIYLMKADQKFTSGLKAFEHMIEMEKNNTLTYSYDDFTKIPVIKFHIKHFFPEYEGERFSTEENGFTVLSVYQRNAFLLNNEGAKVESEASIEVVEDAMEVEEQPKYFIFSEPFYLFLKKKDATHPYFMVKVVDAELLSTFKE